MLPSLGQARAIFYERVFAARVRLPRDRPTISFTFDDVPRTALTHGLPVLERHGIEATFYLAGVFAQKEAASPRRKHLSTDDVRALHAAGHQIGCHTYSHRRLSTLTAQQSFLDAQRNRALWQDALGQALDDFSYPFGDITAFGKRALKPCYASLRGIRPGINRGTIDLASLRATPLYARPRPEVDPAAMIDDCAARGGWLVFFTHGVHDERPGAYDASLSGFRSTVERARASGARILSVARARDYLLGTSAT